MQLTHPLENVEPSLQQIFLRRWATYFAIFVLVIAIFVLAGRGIELLGPPLAWLPAMNSLTALNFLFAGVSFLLLSPHRPFPFSMASFAGRRGLTGWVLAGIVVLIGVLKAAGLLPGVHEPSDHTALCFMLGGVCLFLLNRRAPGGSQPAQLIALLIAGISVFTLIEDLYHVKDTLMAVQAAVCFLFLSLAMLLARPGEGIMKELTGAGTGSATARSLLPLVIFLPIVLGYLRLLVYWKGLISTELGLAFLVSAIIFTFSAVVWFITRLLNRRDEQKQAAELKLQETEHHFELLVGSVKDYAIFMLDPSGRIISWNEGAERIKGYSREEILGQDMSVFYTPAEIGRGEPHYNLSQAKLYGHFEQEGERVRKDGSIFWASVVFTALREANGRLVGFAKVTRDITERRRSEEQVTYMARLMEDATDAVFSTDASFVIRTWNKAAELLYGYSLAEVRGRSARAILRTQMKEDIIGEIREKMLRTGYWKGEVYYLTKSGMVLTIMLSASAVKDKEGRPDGFVMVCRDFTERKKLELQLEQFNKELEEQVRRKTDEITRSYQEIRQLASHLQDVREEERAGIAREIHDELGQQLTGLKMDISWMSKRKTVQEDSELRQKAAATMGLLDTTIMTVRRIATDLRPSILDDLGLVAAIEWQCQEFGRRSGIRTEFTSAVTDFPHSSGIAIGLFRICQESLTNVARHAAASRISISFQRENNAYILKIEDNGKGFEVGTTESRKTLGLLVMKERALMMGGEFKIESEPGMGTTLFVTVPTTTSQL